VSANGTIRRQASPARCRHPSRYRRLVARLDVLPKEIVNRIEACGLLLQKIANVIRFEWFWKRHVSGKLDVVVVESFDTSRITHPIWDIALKKVEELGKDGLILEFGCNNGGSLLYFSKRVPESMHLIGFDCFEGLPEAWDSLPRGSIKGFGAPLELWNAHPEQKPEVLARFRRDGLMPHPPQPNVSIEVGLFSESVPRFLRNGIPNNIRLIHFDADIYMSTRPVLDSIAGQIKSRYFILFDEFYSVNHEFKAWMEFVAVFGLSRWRVIAGSEDGVQMLIEINHPDGVSSSLQDRADRPVGTHREQHLQ